MTKITCSEIYLLIILSIITSGTVAGDKKTTGTIMQMTTGDHACYVDFMGEHGQPFSEMAAFEICERNDLIGQQVKIEYEEGNVYAASCQGNMDCTETERVMLVTSVKPVNSTGPDSSRCFDNAVNQSELNRCAAGEYETAEAEMSKVYAAIQKQHQDDPEFLEKLELSQLAWMEFRDAEVEARYAHQDEPGYYGSVFPMCLNGLLAELTRARIRQLQHWLQVREEGNVCLY